MSSARPRVSAVLTTIFNCFALNAVLVVACLPVVTIPVAVRAALVALDRWRDDDEDRVVAVFIAALRASRLRSVTAAIGVPSAATLLAALEMQFFADPRNPEDWVCLGLGASAVFICLASVGYSIVLSARRADLGPVAIWSASAWLAVRNALGASALLVVEFTLLGAVLARDASLTVVCIPLALVALVRVTAGRPIEQATGIAGPAVAEPPQAPWKTESGEVVGR